MAQFVVKQPNGKFSLFSEVVDKFITANLDESGMSAYLRSRGMSKENANIKVQSAINDRCIFNGKCMEGEWRWNYACDVIRDIHGQVVLNEILEEIRG